MAGLRKRDSLLDRPAELLDAQDRPRVHVSTAASLGDIVPYTGHGQIAPVSSNLPAKIDTRVVHDLVGGRIEPERMNSIDQLRFRATHWVDGIEVGDLIRWNPARDVQS